MDENTFNQDGIVMLDLHSGNYKLEIKPGEKNYTQSLLWGINKVHFANFRRMDVKSTVLSTIHIQLLCYHQRSTDVERST